MKKGILLFLFIAFSLSYEAMSQCGQIGLVGEWGWENDSFLTPDPVDTNLYTTMLSLTSEMNSEGASDIIFMKFRENAGWAVNWGADTFPGGIGTQNGPNIPVPIDTAANITDYYVTFNCATGEYYFASASVTAVRAYAMTIDGKLDEPEWDLNRTVSKVISGTVTDDPNEIHFGVAYDNDSLYIGIDIKDLYPTIYEMGEVFIDGDNSNGAFDSHDLQLRFNGPIVTIVQGPPALKTSVGFQLQPGVGYSAELSIPLADFGITPNTEAQIGFDIIIGDGDSGTGVDYMMSWVGGLDNYAVTSFFGTLVFADYSGVDEIEDYSAFVVLFPNPSNNNVYLRLANSDFDGNVNVYVTDMAGRVVRSNGMNFHGAGDQILLNVDEYTPGIYFVNIYDDNGLRAVKKLIVY